jgi:hypothetical protein
MLTKTISLLREALTTGSTSGPDRKSIRGVKWLAEAATKALEAERPPVQNLEDPEVAEGYRKACGTAQLLYNAVVERQRLMIELYEGSYTPLDVDALPTPGGGGV